VTTQTSTSAWALALLRSNSPYGQALEDHCRRLHGFATNLAAQDGVVLDDDLLLAACFLHDIGLCVRDSSSRDYIERGLDFVEARLADSGLGLTAQQEESLVELMRTNHSLLPLRGLSPQAEMLRRAVQVEHSLGFISFGLPAEARAEVFSRFPRANFNQVLLGFFRTALVDDDPRALLHVFLPGGWAQLRAAFTAGHSSHAASTRNLWKSS